MIAYKTRYLAWRATHVYYTTTYKSIFAVLEIKYKTTRIQLLTCTAFTVVVLALSCIKYVTADVCSIDRYNTDTQLQQQCNCRRVQS